MSQALLFRVGFAAAAAALVAALPALGQQKKADKAVRKEDWKEHKPPADFRFTCKFPGNAAGMEADTSTQLGNVRLYNAELEVAGVTFMVTCLRYPDDLRLADPKAPLVNARSATIARLKGALRSDKDLTVDGLSVHETVYATFLGGKQTWTARFVQVGPRVYVVQAGRPERDDPAAAAAVTAFLEAFKPQK
jgi:hypothetical protein